MEAFANVCLQSDSRVIAGQSIDLPGSAESPSGTLWAPQTCLGPKELARLKPEIRAALVAAQFKKINI